MAWFKRNSHILHEVVQAFCYRPAMKKIIRGKRQKHTGKGHALNPGLVHEHKPLGNEVQSQCQRSYDNRSIDLNLLITQ